MPANDKPLIRVTLATMTAVIAATSVATAAADPALSTDQLAGLQPSSDDVAPIVRWPIGPPPALNVSGTWQAPFIEGENISDPGCIGAVTAGGVGTYRGSGYTAVSIQQLTAADQYSGYNIVSAAASFFTPEAAKAFLAKVTQTWTGCHWKTVSFNAGGQDQTWEVHMPVTNDHNVTVVSYQKDGTQGACSHALAVKANVAAEVNACRSNIGLIDQGLTIANNMLAKVPG